MMLLLVFIIAACAVSGPSRTCPYATRDDLLPCITRALDIDDNGVITESEIDLFLDAQPPIIIGKKNEPRGISVVNVPWECLPTGWKDTFLNSTIIMTLCDRNSDAVLDSTDWASASSCLKSRSMQDIACVLCEKCLATAPGGLLKKK